MEKIINKHQTSTDVYTALPTGTGNLLELFAGSRSVGKVGERLGYNVFSIDWKEYEGIDLAIDIGNLTKEDVPFVPDVVWASPDCTTYSIAACSTHRNNSIEPKSDYAKKCDQVNENFIGLIKQWLKINPKMVFLLKTQGGCFVKCRLCRNLKGTQYGIANMGMTEPSRLMFGLIAKIGHQDHNVRTETLTAITNEHREEVRQERKGEKEAMKRSIIPYELCLEVLSSACG
jgi:hypothetical protein